MPRRLSRQPGQKHQPPPARLITHHKIRLHT
jgi:hypothetical protein